MIVEVGGGDPEPVVHSVTRIRFLYFGEGFAFVHETLVQAIDLCALRDGELPFIHESAADRWRQGRGLLRQSAGITGVAAIPAATKTPFYAHGGFSMPLNSALDRESPANLQPLVQGA